MCREFEPLQLHIFHIFKACARGYIMNIYDSAFLGTLSGGEGCAPEINAGEIGAMSSKVYILLAMSHYLLDHLVA